MLFAIDLEATRTVLRTVHVDAANRDDAIEWARTKTARTIVDSRVGAIYDARVLSIEPVRDCPTGNCG